MFSNYFKKSDKWFLFLFHPVNLETGEAKFDYYWITSAAKVPEIFLEKGIQETKKILFDEEGKIMVVIY